MKRLIWQLTALFCVLTVVFSVLSVMCGNSVVTALAITFGTTLYHFVMRLSVGAVTPKCFKYNQSWFVEKSFEKKLYKFLKVKKWKKYMPSYNPASYIVDKNTDFELMADNTCRNEVIHSVIAVLSYVPLLFSIWLGEFWVFFITSIIASSFDMIFVIMQRYNRPRLVAYLIRRKGRNL